MKLHWKVLVWMLGGVVLGVVLQFALPGPAWTGGTFVAADDRAGVELAAATGPASGGKLSEVRVGDVYTAAVLRRGEEDEERVALDDPAALAPGGAALGRLEPGMLLWLERADGELVSIRTELDPSSSRSRALYPFDLAADLFLSLLKMLIVPLVLTSIVNGVASVGSGGALRRLGLKTFGYYILSSLLAILVGQVLVSIIRPGVGARLGLPLTSPGTEHLDFVDILRRMIPDNVPAALTDNSAMLSIIFFALLFGYFVTRTAEPHQSRVKDLFESLFEVMLVLAQGVLALLPYGVFALMVRVVGNTGLAVFEPLALYMLTVTLALFLHAGVTLPALLKFVGGVSPRRWFKAMSPALATAFSTSSSSMTLPVSLETVEQRGKVSNRVTSFTLPLGATINMDGTALYECIGVVFLAQYYASIGGEPLSLGAQALVVILALFASIGAAGIPSAGLVMMLTILSALELPLEGAALLLAVDRPLDMLRTTVNVWSDTCGAAVVARTEGEEGPLHAGVAAVG